MDEHVGQEHAARLEETRKRLLQLVDLEQDQQLRDQCMPLTTQAPKLLTSAAAFEPAAGHLNLTREPCSIQPHVVKSAAWSPDGEIIFTNSEDNCLRSYFLPSQGPLCPVLKECSAVETPEAIRSFAVHPSFDIRHTSTQIVLTAVVEQPIRLINPFEPSTILSSYPLIDPNTEAVITPHCSLFTRDGTHFISGSNNLIAVFDIERPSQGPVQYLRTAPRRSGKPQNQHWTNMHGIISALSISCDGLLAASTYNSRMIGIYADEGQGETMNVFSLADQAEPEQGTGTTSILWSPNGRYLYTAERKAGTIAVWDIRASGRKLATLTGRPAWTSQRLGVDMIRTEEGHDIIAGCDDGTVRIWRKPFERQGKTEPDSEWKAHDSHVTATIVHPHYPSVVATCAGEHEFPESDSDSETEEEDEEDSATEDSIYGPIKEKSNGFMKVWTL